MKKSFRAGAVFAAAVFFSPGVSQTEESRLVIADEGQARSALTRFLEGELRDKSPRSASSEVDSFSRIAGNDSAGFVFRDRQGRVWRVMKNGEILQFDKHRDAFVSAKPGELP